MGVSVSRYSELASNPLIERFCSTEIICPNDPFWNQMLAFNITPPANAEEQLVFDSSTEALLQKFLENNLQTGNLGSLIQVFITRATELLASPSTDSAMLAWQTFNALFVIRAVIKYLVEMIPDWQLARHTDAPPATRRAHLDDTATPPSPPPSPTTPAPESPTSQASVTSPATQAPVASPELRVSNESRLEMLTDALVGLICDVPVTENTYYLHLECINTILVLMSVYMFASQHGLSRPVEDSLVYRTIFRGRYALHAPLLVKTLLGNLSRAAPAPPTMFGYTDDGGSLVINLASGLWSMLTFSTASARQTIFTHPPVDKSELTARLIKEHPVANQSCLLLLALTNHCMNDDNLYRRALLCCEDSSSESSSSTSQKDAAASGVQITPPRIDMAALHTTLCTLASCEHFTLLLYLLLHSCRAYKRHVSTQPHIDNLIIPILQTLYDAPDTSHHIYMSLIVLLILTEDEALTKAVHQITIKNPVWYTERCLSEISLGGLIVLLIARTVQYNIVRVRDKYLHTNCLAALANMSAEFRNLHPYVAQRLVSLYETLTKRRARLIAEIEACGHKAEELWEHVCVLDEVLRMLLEILNSCLSSQLQSNLQLVYALLHKKQVFASQPRDQPTASNIEMVIGYFSSRLQRVQEGAGGDLGVAEVLACISKGAEQWSNDRLKKFPSLLFRYVEEDRPEEFFTPYVWGLISSLGAVYWASEGAVRAASDLLQG